MAERQEHKPWGQVSRGRTGAHHIAWEQFSPDWTEEELTVAWAACPRPGQSYNKDQPEVRDVADLIGRTPSAVSRKFGNLHSAWRPGTGLAHGSKRDKIVVDRYRGREDSDLIRDANRLRTRLWGKCPSFRVEGAVEREPEREAVFQRIQAIVTEIEIDPDATLTYRRRGSLIIGFVIATWWVLENWDRIPRIIERIKEVVPKLKGSLGFEDANARRIEAFAEDKIKNVLVGLHFSEFGRSGLRDLAILLDRFEVEKIRFTLKLAKKFPNIDHATEKSRFESYTGVHIPSEVCGKCLVMLLAALEQMIENGLTTPRG